MVYRPQILPVIAGGTGASTAGGAQTNLGLGTMSTQNSNAVSITGITDLAVADGGTGLSAGTSGGVLGFTGATTLASSVALTANQIVLGGGAGATPAPLGSLGTTTTVLHGNAAGAPTFGAVSLTADITGNLPVANGGTGASTAAGARTNLGIVSNITVYQNQNIKASPKIWNGQATTTGGVATFFPTSDNTGAGTALFTSIYSVQSLGQRNTATAIQVPSAALKAISGDLKTITVNLVNGQNIGLLGAPSAAFAPDGTNVHLVIIGE